MEIVMYQLKINLLLPIEGCPESGIEAVEFREQHGIERAASNLLRVSVEADGEPGLCNRYKSLLDNDADLVVNYDRKTDKSRTIPRPLWNYQYGDSATMYESVIPLPLAKKLGDNPLAALPELLDSLLDQAAETRRIKEQAKQEERRKQEAKQAEEQKIKLLLSQEKDRLNQSPVVKLFEFLSGGSQLKIYWTNESLALEKTSGGYDIYRDPGKASAAVARRERERHEYREWIEHHGSDRLKRCVAEGIDCAACYRDERLAKERPGWRWTAKIDGEYNDPRNPSEEAFALLDQARATLPEDAESQLVYWTGEKTDYRGYAVISEYLDREIVFGGPEE